MTDDDASAQSPPPEAISAAEASPPPPVENTTLADAPEVAPEEVSATEALPPEEPTQPSQNSVSASATPAAPPSKLLPPLDLPARGLAARRSRQQKKLDEILVLAKKKEFVTNDDVEKLLHVSNATATRHLDTLVKSGKVQRIGIKSHAKYVLIKNT